MFVDGVFGGEFGVFVLYDWCVCEWVWFDDL